MVLPAAANNCFKVQQQAAAAAFFTSQGPEELQPALYRRLGVRRNAPSTFPRLRFLTDLSRHFTCSTAPKFYTHQTFTVPTMADETTPSDAETLPKQWRSAMRIAAGAIEDAESDFETTVDEVRLFYEAGRIRYELLPYGRSGDIEGRTAAELFVSASVLRRDGAFEPASVTVLVGNAETPAASFVPAAMNRPHREAGARAAVAIQAQAQPTAAVAVSIAPVPVSSGTDARTLQGNDLMVLGISLAKDSSAILKACSAIQTMNLKSYTGSEYAKKKSKGLWTVENRVYELTTEGRAHLDALCADEGIRMRYEAGRAALSDAYAADGPADALKCKYCNRVLGNMGALVKHEASCPKRTDGDDSDDSDDSDPTESDSDEGIPPKPPPPPPVGAPVWIRRALEHTLLETGIARLRGAIGGDERNRLDPVELYASPEVRVGVGDGGVVTLTFVDGSKSRDVPVTRFDSFDATLACISQTIRSEVYESVDSVVVAVQVDGFQTREFDGLVYAIDDFRLSWGVQPPPVGTEVELDSDEHRSSWEPDPFIVAKVRATSFAVRECDEWIHASGYGQTWRYPSKPTAAKRARDAVADTTDLLGALFGQERALDDKIPFVGGTIVIRRASARAGTTVHARILDDSGTELGEKVQCTRGDVENLLSVALNPPKPRPVPSPKGAKAVVAAPIPIEPSTDSLLADADRALVTLEEASAAIRREDLRASRSKLLKRLLKRLDAQDLDDADLEKRIATGLRDISERANATSTPDPRINRIRTARDAYAAARDDLAGLVAEFGAEAGPSASSAEAPPSSAKKARLRK